MPTLMRIAVPLLLLSLGVQAGEDSRDVLYQLSTIPDLSAGVYDGFRPYSHILAKGDFGIGTFEHLAGEMIMLDGVAYQALVDGRVLIADPTNAAPYATVTCFDTDQSDLVSRPLDYVALQQHLDSILHTRDIPIAVRIEGVFRYVRIRSVPAQERPYPPLAAAIEKQQVFELTNVTGTAVGFRFPASLGGVQAVGYHMHFLTKDAAAGGHILELQTDDVRVDVDYTPEFLLEFPRHSEACATP